MVLGAEVAVVAKEEKPAIWVKPGSPVQAISSLITSSICEDKKITLRAIGAGAVNQAIKGAIQARQVMALAGEDLYLRPGFTTVQGRDGTEVTAIVMHLFLM